MSKAKELKMAKDIIGFCIDNSLFINPNFSVRQWANKVLEKGGQCPCVPSRKGCPCAECLNDIQREGKCRCNFFFNQEQYRELLKANR